jgi:hypothetical protein
MAVEWKLRRTAQCKKCPWIAGSDPRQIPNGYCETKHRALEGTIAKPGDLSFLAGGGLPAMACHETDEAHCVGWLVNQLGPGNNIGLRLRMSACANVHKIKLRGEQHARFEDTLPEPQDD